EVRDTDIHNKGIIRLGKKDANNGTKNRPVLVRFKERSIKNNIMESLIKLKKAEDKFKNIGISHDLAPSDREECKKLVLEAKTKQDKEEGEYLWRVRGLPGQLKIVRIKKIIQEVTIPKEVI
ncbi:MAG TPA: hypothetical protein VJP58_09105, partial [Candidatus Nitrosocosmicus sp.]|nr:hypothetical protein [Candidatus Nitrosocosmicus sp.]